MNQQQKTNDKTALERLTEKIVASSEAPDSSVVALPDARTAELRKGRLVIRAPSLELSPFCVSTCVACIGGCFPCTSSACHVA